MENQTSKTRLFSVELKSKAHLKNVMLINGGLPEAVMIEGVLGELKQARVAEGILLGVVGSNGVLRVDLRENEISKSQLKNENGSKPIQ